MTLKNEKGITLIEIMAATVILSIVVVVFMNISQYLTLTSGKDDKRAEALQIANQQLNTIRGALPTTTPFPNVGTLNSSTTVDGYQVTVNETAMTDTVSSGYSNIPSLSNHVSLQAVVLLFNTATGENEPRLLTVTVSWGD